MDKNDANFTQSLPCDLVITSMTNCELPKHKQTLTGVFSIAIVVVVVV